MTRAADFTWVKTFARDEHVRRDVATKLDETWVGYEADRPDTDQVIRDEITRIADELTGELDDMERCESVDTCTAHVALRRHLARWLSAIVLSDEPPSDADRAWLRDVARRERMLRDEDWPVGP